MKLEGMSVKHKAFGAGVITEKKDTYITIVFTTKGEKTFRYPEAFAGYLTVEDDKVISQIESDIEIMRQEELRIKKENEEKLNRIVEEVKNIKNQVYPKANVAINCTFCDGGQTDDIIGFAGVCSDEVIYNNVETESRQVCTGTESFCKKYLDEEITREELDELYENETFICNECRLLGDWKVQTGTAEDMTGQEAPSKLSRVRQNSLCVLTAKEPGMSETERFIFAVFMADEVYEGDSREQGHITALSEYRLAFSLQEAKSLPFWKFYTDHGKQEKTIWDADICKYFEDEQAAQILKSAAEIKIGTDDEEDAEQFFQYYCEANDIDPENVPAPAGLLMKKKKKAERAKKTS